MRKLFLAVLIILFSYPVSLAKNIELEWDHDCIGTTGFNVYYCNPEGHCNEMAAKVLCPATSIELDALRDGSYAVTAYNEYESDFSNELILAGYYYNATRFDYENSRVIYKGEHVDHDASVDDTGWVITKYYYAPGGAFLTHFRVRTLAWSGRTVGW